METIKQIQKELMTNRVNFVLYKNFKEVGKFDTAGGQKLTMYIADANIYAMNHNIKYDTISIDEGRIIIIPMIKVNIVFGCKFKGSKVQDPFHTITVFDKKGNLLQS
jgi:hypothetical protein